MSPSRVFTLLVVLWVASEFGIWLFRRSRSAGSSGTFSAANLVLWGVIGLAVWLAIVVQRLSFAHMGGSSQALLWMGLSVFAAGVAIRWWAISVLGRFFTSDLVVQQGHRIVQTGLYRVVRHPSYSGILICFLGIGLAMYNWLSLLCLLGLVGAAIVYRTHVEEAMLEKEFGDVYVEYRRRTRRLVPGLF